MKHWYRGMTLVIGLLAVVSAAGCQAKEKVSEDTVTVQMEKAVAETKAEAVLEKKKIALTFDDGPHPIYTEQMLQVLEEKQVKASFFLLGENIELYPEVVEQISKAGHLIGNHTYHHVQITGLSKEEAFEEIQLTSDRIEELTGQGTEYVRPPFGTWNSGLEEELDLIPVMWSVDTLDWTTRNVDWIVAKVQKEVGENDIILMHDSYKSTVQAVERLIPLLEAEGYEFVTVDEVLMD
jgi:peptidoglycan/xylan/chitin deacetylase (PgdA/CDA1 family)